MPELPPSARRALIRLLLEPSYIRAERIQELHQREETREFAELLMDLEAEPDLQAKLLARLTELEPDSQVHCSNNV